MPVNFTEFKNRTSQLKKDLSRYYDYHTPEGRKHLATTAVIATGLLGLTFFATACAPSPVTVAKATMISVQAEATQMAAQATNAQAQLQVSLAQTAMPTFAEATRQVAQSSMNASVNAKEAAASTWDGAKYGLWFMGLLLSTTVGIGVTRTVNDFIKKRRQKPIVQVDENSGLQITTLPARTETNWALFIAGLLSKQPGLGVDNIPGETIFTSIIDPNTYMRVYEDGGHRLVAVNQAGVEARLGVAKATTMALMARNYAKSMEKSGGQSVMYPTWDPGGDFIRSQFPPPQDQVLLQDKAGSQ